MSHKRKQVRKVKKAMKRQVQKAKEKHEKQEKQLPNQEMLLKLMAMMKGGPGSQPMDAATFLKLKEEAVAKEKENNRLLREAKQTEQNAKNDEKEAKGKFTVKQAKAKANAASTQRDHTIETLDAKSKEQGLTQEERLKKERIAELAHQQEMNRVTGNMDATTARIGDLDRRIKHLGMSIDLIQTSPKVKELLKMLQESQERISNTWGELYEGIKKAALTKDETNKLETLIDDISKQEADLLRTKAQIDFEKKQYENEIKSKEQRVDEFHRLKKAINDGKFEVQSLKEKAKVSGYIYDQDEDGNIIETYDKSKEVTPIPPDKDGDYK